MYGKVFESIYDGSLYGQWEAIVTMQQLIVLADAEGVIDMTLPAIAGKTSIPIEILEKGLKILSEPDPHSRSPKSDGVRIQLLDDQRPWGWFLVNHQKYMNLRTAEDRRTYMRDYMRKRREAESVNNSVNSCKQSLAQLANVDVDVDKEGGRASRFAPEDFEPTKEMRDWALSQGFLLAEIIEETAKFKDYERAKPIKDWNRAWRNWFRKAKEWRKERVGETTPETTADVAARLGITQNPDEPEDKFKIRVRDSMLAQEYRNCAVGK